LFSFINLFLAVKAKRTDSDYVAEWKRLHRTVLGGFALLLLLQGFAVLVFSGIEWLRLGPLLGTAVVMLHEPLLYVFGVAGVLLIAAIFRAWWRLSKFERGVGGKF